MSYHLSENQTLKVSRGSDFLISIVIDFTAPKHTFLRKVHLCELTFLIFMESLERRVGYTSKYMWEKI